MSREEILLHVRDVIWEMVESVTLFWAKENILPSHRLQADIGFEWIDFVDLAFRLERAFGIKARRDELDPEFIFQGDPECVRGGIVTPGGLEELRRKIPFADLREFEKDPRVSNISDLFTVDLVCRYVEMQFSRHAATP